MTSLFNCATSILAEAAASVASTVGTALIDDVYGRAAYDVTEYIDAT